MSITDELRRVIEDPLLGYAPQDQHIKILTEIADRIDIAHKHAIGYVDDRDPETMAENGWVKLPADADGEPIHIGDVMESKGSDFLFGENSFEVRSMRCDECGWEVYDRLGGRYAPSLLQHHHAPTVEDVLREMLYKAHIYDRQEMELLPDLIAEYATKLRLAGDAE